jgi:hypothetical protein
MQKETAGQQVLQGKLAHCAQPFDRHFVWFLRRSLVGQDRLRAGSTHLL